MSKSNISLLPEYLRKEVEEADTEIRKDLSDVKMAVQKERKRMAEKYLRLWEELELLDQQ